MKKQLLSVFICLSMTVIHAGAQTFKYDFSKSMATAIPNLNAIPVDDGWIIMQKKSGGRLYSMEIVVELVRYNKKMEKIKSVIIPLKEQKFVVLKGLYGAKGECNLIYGYKEKKADDILLLSGIRINPADLSVKGEVSLGSVSTSGKYSIFTGNGGYDEISFAFNYSIDSSKFYLLTYPQQKKKDAKQFGFAILNSDLSKVYERSIELDVQSRYVEIESTTLDNEDNFYVQRRTIPTEDATSYIDKDDLKYAPEETILTHYTKDAASGKDIPLDQPGKYVYETKMTLKKATHKLEIVGTYKATQKGRITGILFCQYDPVTKKISEMKSSPIPGNVLDLLEIDKVAKSSGKDQGLSLAFTVAELTYRPNGSVDCMLEFQNAEERYITSSNGATGGSYFKFFSNSILNVNISGNGNMIFTRIPKKQKIEDYSSYTSFYSFYRGNQLILIYNDDKKNVDRDLSKAPDEVQPDRRSSVLMAAIIDEKGALRREIIYEHNDDDYVTVPQFSRTISGNNILLTKIKTGKVFEWEATKVGVLNVL